MRLKNENDKSIEDLELSKRKAEDEHLSQQEVAKKTNGSETRCNRKGIE